MPNDYSKGQSEWGKEMKRLLDEVLQNRSLLLSQILVTQGYIFYRLEKMDQKLDRMLHKLDNIGKHGFLGKE